MSSLTDVEKRYFEALFGMSGGYVLDYTDATFAELFNRHGIDIHSQRYTKYGTSKAKKLRAFWEQEQDTVVAHVLSEMLDSYVAQCEINGSKPNQELLKKCRAIVARLSGGQTPTSAAEAVEEFLSREFTIPDLHKLPVEAGVVDIIADRLEEARKALAAGCPLAVIFLCGSILEGVLLGAAQNNPEKFNRASSSPKTPEGKVKPYRQWSLAQLIDVAHEVGLLSFDVKKFSHGLRDFRNFIHPYEQMASKFAPDIHTAKVCFQVLKAALASLAGER
ncbi:hypothetical protein Rhom172_1466 [Rhodothermus marinus SG0.5JP17-172]|mgnify:CR=1 FL=1|uniref:hypothetical protein n=1 Tax=Rhodothermus marinus TaxID=29549 RepID=UPI000223D853|nr:hypothetical protein [Rhodothermus marinus]AEN73389.1 hypothetical protein Rhom172_1466 [Rhodothermus marinus SG0.5JP17-172]